MNDFDANLIREFRTRPAFYDRNNPRFKDKVFTAREWQEISNKLGYDVSLLKDRMLQLRNRYNLEKRRIEQVREENPGVPVESPWPLFEHLQFLSEHIRARRSYKRMLNSTQPQHNNIRLEVSGGSNSSSGGEADGDDTLNDNDNEKSNAMMQQISMHHPFLPVRVKLENHEDDADANGGNSNNEGSLLQQMQQAYQEQQHKQDQQRQQQQIDENDTDADESESQSVTDNGAFLTAQSAAMLQNKQYASKAIAAAAGSQLHQHNRHSYPQRLNPAALAQPALKVRRLDAMRSIITSIPTTALQNNHQHNKKHQNRSNSNSFSSSSATAAALPPPPPQLASSPAAAAAAAALPITNRHLTAANAINAYATAREQKYAAFGDFVASSLLDLPSIKAMQLIEKFTSEVVKVLIENDDANNHRLQQQQQQQQQQHAANSTITSAAAAAATANTVVNNCNGSMKAAVN